jgi:hypothetical protein
MWAVHVVHHSSEHYNLSTALRQPVADAFGTYLPYGALALFGIRPELISTARDLNLLYQYWIHTDTIRHIGPLERVLNTPSHHRVHHGSNRSCDSDSRISYGVIPASRTGTRLVSISTPTPPRAAISAEELVSPAAPMSWSATITPELISSRLASSSSFSVNGSPTCTWGRRFSLSAESSSDAKLAP